ncbi:hypothetical protein ACFL2H_00595 [Planctomycetota bacterium]
MTWLQVVCCWMCFGAIGWSQSARDIRDVSTDLRIPPLSEAAPSEAAPSAGRRVKQTLPGYPKAVYHVLYLPSDWQPTEIYPVIVEYAGNGPYQSSNGDVSTGYVEGSKLGYGITGGKKAIWLCLPFLNNDATENVRTWWGDAPEYNVTPTVDYCKKAVPWICETYQGDPQRILLVGFSRGAIACNYVGLHDDEIAKLWKCMIPFSHYDGVRRWPYPRSDRESALERLARLGDCEQLICSEHTGGNANLQATRDYLRSTKAWGQTTFLETGFRNHNDAWILRPSGSRDALRKWVSKRLQVKLDE